MWNVSVARLTMAVLALRPVSALADPVELDLRGALARAHLAAPEVLAARGRVAEAEAGVLGADIAFTTNPEIEGGAGPRLTPGRPIDAEVRIEQNLESWRRGPRRQVAGAALRQARAEADRAMLDLDLEVSLAFYDALFADRAAELARRAQELAQRAAAAAERRRLAGDITDLEANLARAASGRAASAALAAASARALAVGRLAAQLGIAPGDTILLRGDLAPAALPDPAALRTALATRPDVRALDAEREAAAAQRVQAIASGRPEIALWAGYQREDAQAIVLGGLRVSLPLWNRAQGEQAAAAAREHSAQAVRDATVRAANRQIDDAVAAYTAARQAVETFARDVAPLLDDSERLLERRIDAGQLTVSDYLVARQELLAARREYLERQLALARVAATVRFVAGVAP